MGLTLAAFLPGVAQAQKKLVVYTFNENTLNDLVFGAFTKDRSPRDAISVACMLGANGLAYILLILVLNLAQCSWWYEPGMYNGGYEHEYSIGR